MTHDQKALSEALRRWYAREKIVPIERGISYRLEREAREASRSLPAWRPTPPEFPGAA